jgi:hypothetical protein
MPKKSLADTHPEVAKEWHPTKNGDLTPEDVTKGSKKRLWWKCDKGDDHEWSATVNNRTSGSNCSICRGLKVVNSNCLATVNPLLSKQWHPTKNGDLTPYDFTYGSGKKVWWKCPKGSDHEWLTSISNRVTRESNCPYCSGNKVALSNCLATIKPELAKQWHPTLNGDLTPNDVTVGSRKKVWWKCPKGSDHEWLIAVGGRENSKLGCPICSGHKVVLSTCLATTHPEIAKQWHPTKNGDLTPYNVKAGVRKKVWWKCDKGDDHEWKTSIGNRTYHKSGCAICAGWIITKSTCLATTHPEIAKEWHPTKNRDLTPYDVKSTGYKKVWWKCDKGDDHEWSATVGNRIGNGTGCPFCTLTPQSKQELTITFELMKLFKNIDPKGLKTRLDGSLKAIDIFIPKLNLCIEFDGSYWHKDRRDIDKIKSEMLFEEGFKLIRVNH